VDVIGVGVIGADVIGADVIGADGMLPTWTRRAWTGARVRATVAA
jgi:hypothetical protein